MSHPSSSPWIWSEALQQYIYPTVEDGVPVYITRDGTRLRAPGAGSSNVGNTNNPAPADPSVPRRPTNTAGLSLQQPASDPTGVPQYTLHNNRPSQPQQTAEQLAERLKRTDLGGGASSSQQQGVTDYVDSNGTRARVEVRRDGIVLYATPGDVERLDASYCKRDKPRAFFKVGKVFFTLWSEPAQDGSTGLSKVRYGEHVYSSIRRFVVVRESTNFCQAVQITTYGGRSYSKPGIDRSEHALIHTGPAPTVPRHSGLLPLTIRVDDSSDGLDPRSVVNLGKVYTIEHYVKVKHAGTVRNIPELLSAWARVGGRAGSHAMIQARDAAPEPNVSIVPVARSGGGSQGARTRHHQPAAAGEPARRPAAGAPAQTPGNDYTARWTAAYQAGQCSREEFERAMLAARRAESQAQRNQGDRLQSEAARRAEDIRRRTGPRGNSNDDDEDSDDDD